MSLTDLANVECQSSSAAVFAVDIEPFRPPQQNSSDTDYYEILRIGPQADGDTIERVYRTLAARFHPDNPGTGDAETFLRLIEAYETLSNHTKRAKYNVRREYSRASTRFWLRKREFFDGVRGGQNRRLAVLCLLYRQRIVNPESPGLTILDLETATGCTREEVTAALWYLCEKQWATIGDFTAYSITAEGFDFVESKLEERMEFRALATASYYRSSTVLENAGDHAEPAFPKRDALPLDIEPALTSQGDFFIADHYEILGIAPNADEETIERVYRTLAARFHPDNPSTGDAKTFLRIRDAWETLSATDKRAEYDVLRQRTKYTGRFRLRGREFFEGIQGEQLRRLAVLCLLYRQAASELPGLTVLDLEHLTGCTREELGSILWYLREKKWAKFGEYTDYSITAAGFDVVESQLDNHDGTRSRTWIIPEESITGDIPGQEFVYPQLTATAEIVEAAEPSKDDDSPAHTPEDTPNSLQSLIAGTSTGPENWNSKFAGMSPTDVYQYLLWLKRSGESPEEQPAAAPQSARIEEEPAVEETQIPGPEKFDEIPTPESVVSVSNPPTPVNQNSNDTEADQADVHRSRSTRSFPGFVRRFLGFDGRVRVRPKALAAKTSISPENWEWHRLTETGRPHEEADVVQRPSPLEQLAHLAEAPEQQATQPALHMQPEVAQEPSPLEQLAQLPEAPEAPEQQTTQPALHTQPEVAQEPSPLEQLAQFPEAPEAPEAPEQQTAQPAPQTQPEVAAAPASPQVSDMNTSIMTGAGQAAALAVSAAKRVIFSMGGKGGVGKTSVMTGLAEWFEENRIPVTLLDLDTENKAKGSLTHFFGGRVPKINIHTPAGLDTFVDILAEDAPAILADMGAGAGQVTHDWFQKMYPDVAETGVVFTAVGVVTSDPASVESVLNWAAALQDRVAYVIVENSLSEHADFTYWQQNDAAKEFRKQFQPPVIRLDNRLADLENAARNHGVTLGRVAGRTTSAPELQKASLVMRAQSYRRRMFAEFDKVKELLLP